MSQSTRNIARRFAVINKASNGLLLDLIERYEEAALAEVELEKVAKKIEEAEAALDKAQTRTGDSKAERVIEYRLVALDAKHETLDKRCDRAEECVRRALERLANQIDATVLLMLNA